MITLRIEEGEGVICMAWHGVASIARWHGRTWYGMTKNGRG